MNEKKEAVEQIAEYVDRSCASTTVKSIAASGVDSKDAVFINLISQAHKLGLMPDDRRCVWRLLKEYGFMMQSGALENISVRDACDNLAQISSDKMFVIVQTRSRWYSGGEMNIIPINCQLVRGDSDANSGSMRFLDYTVKHLWIRWPDGMDHSPYPRKIRMRSTKQHALNHAVGKQYYQPFQPNPLGNYIGDCVIRSTAGVLEITWDEALDRLAKYGHTTVNSREIYPLLLKDEGFEHHNPLMRNGRCLTGAAFCNEIGRIYKSGERIFAHVGRLHVAAIVPFKEGTETTYKIVDSWDSSHCTVGEYWVKPQQAVQLNPTSPTG